MKESPAELLNRAAALRQSARNLQEAAARAEGFNGRRDREQAEHCLREAVILEGQANLAAQGDTDD
ncbi:MAG: hypothetical protein Q7U98_17085 [Methylicorpusculum sp.]|uniref:hypothetical protein n=1 Tax=Methylicorpusculum sp. TaxID=2713644 RepID=UPI002723AAD5|nr:hypothetical protein [Methylicorpusculum sp.]MDO8940871.1 hypothetical protein [Methylicorpusculum sp.]MDP2202437.1 hypothetical protein [Methylicorpusculum sp.]